MEKADTVRISKLFNNIVDLEYVKHMNLKNRFQYTLGLIIWFNERAWDIDYEKLNRIIFDFKQNDIEYNMFNKSAFNSYDELMNLYVNYECADSGLGPYLKKICIKCGETFYLYKDEIEWYNMKGFKIPTHCKDCRDAKKIVSTCTKQNTNNKDEISEIKELLSYSPMQAAFDLLNKS